MKTSNAPSIHHAIIHTDGSPSGTSSTVSPVSMISKGHSARSSVSSTSITPSLLPPRDSFDLYGSVKRLEDVREEPQERDDDCGLYESAQFPAHTFCNDLYSTSPTNTQVQMEYSLGDQDAWSTTSSGRHHFKRQRSITNRNSITDKVASRFGSISRKWKTRSLVSPQLSLITSSVVPQRSSSAASSHIVSPALSAISKHESALPTSPVQTSMDETLHESGIAPLFIDDDNMSRKEDEEDQGQATTPLLPPMIADLSTKRDSSLQSPLQSPSIAPVVGAQDSRLSMDNAAASLPSPPLSKRPSMASIPCSPSALQNDIPPLTLYEESVDPWDSLLGHANFKIHPEPYSPEVIDMESYKDFRSNWELARKQYAQHIARTAEHYGGTSRVYKLTQQKWDEVDDLWKRQDAFMTNTLSRNLAPLTNDLGSSESSISTNVLDKPLTRVVVPAFGQSGKFPEIGDADIVGPLTVAPAKAPELQKKMLQTPPGSPGKRNLFKFLSDVLGRHSNGR